MEVMALFVAAVARGARNTHILADMPYGSDTDPARGVANGKRFLSLGAHSVKLEGAKLDVVSAMTSEGIPVIGHLGLLPQTARSFKQVGQDQKERDEVLRSAESLVKAGAFAVLLEHVDFGLAAEITRRLSVPTIGIGAGREVDGQVLVMHDILGLGSGRLPPFARSFAELRREAVAGVGNYCRAVRERGFP
jgi:3-methyl-2-oxobutanoate hydroxymethyltransferase